MPRKTVKDVTAALLEEPNKIHDVRKYKKPSLQDITGRETVHVHAILYKDDYEAAKELAWRRRTAAQAIIRDILTEYIQAHKDELQ